MKPLLPELVWHLRGMGLDALDDFPESLSAPGTAGVCEWAASPTNCLHATWHGRPDELTTGKWEAEGQRPVGQLGILAPPSPLLPSPQKPCSAAPALAVCRACGCAVSPLPAL